MKFARYIFKEKEFIGVIDEELSKITCINDLDDMFSDIRDMNQLIDMKQSYEGFVDTIKKKIKDANTLWLDIDNVKFGAPIPHPKRNIICLGKNYMDHAKETKGLPGGTNEDIPKFPIYFSKIANPAIGDGDVIRSYNEITDKVDYEVELAIIIGKEGINIPREDAEDYIFGYTIVNDISARNIQRKHGQWFKGKCLDTHCPMGPYIVCKDEISFPVELDIQCTINGELRQNSNTRELIFDIPHIIEDLSKGMTLVPGDIIITGTPSGVGLGFKPFKFLKTGDVVECYIEKIGSLRNVFK